MESEPHFGELIVEQLAATIDEASGFKFTKADTSNTKQLVVTLEVQTNQFSRSPDGLPIISRERIDLTFTTAWPFVPPNCTVKHHRWLGYPHVLQGCRLCLYLDPHSEWDPSHGIPGLLRRLWEWLDDAIAGRFDAAAALYQPVGGVLHRTPGSPTLVVKAPIPASDKLHCQRVLLKDRTEHCVDLVGVHSKDADDYDRNGLLITLPHQLPYGAGQRLSDLAWLLRTHTTGGERKRLLAKLRKTARSLANDEPLQVLIGVPNADIEGAARLHLIAFQLIAEDIHPAITAASKPKEADPSDEPLVQWMYVDDLRDAVSTRRDEDTPLAHFRGKHVELWGCGAIGSWMAEVLARAGVRALTLRDPGHVTEGLLVRQNFTADDVGRPKVDALADRLRQINPQLEIEAVHGRCEHAVAADIDADVVIDATVNTAVSFLIEQMQSGGLLEAPLVQIATDTETATHGLLTVWHPLSGTTTNELDQHARTRSVADPDLTRYRPMWHNDSRPPMVPTTGCSTPTFRGSSADLLLIASAAAHNAAHALERTISGAYLFAPHTRSTFVPAVVGAACGSVFPGWLQAG